MGTTVQLLLEIVSLLSVSSLVYSQDACNRLTTTDLGRSDMLDPSGLISEILTPSGEVASKPTVRVIENNIVCEAQHRIQNRYRYTSVVVSFNCFSTDVRISKCANSSVVNTEQFDFGCLNGTWSRNILTVSTAARTANPNATLSTGLDTDCILCINPSNAEAAHLHSPVDSVTHCSGCSNCPIGLQRCHYPVGTTTRQVCCNYFHQGVCVTDCPSPLVPSAKFDCVACGEAIGNCSMCSVSGQNVSCTSCLPGLTVQNGSCVAQTTTPTQTTTLAQTTTPAQTITTTRIFPCGEMIGNCSNCSVSGQNVTCTSCLPGLTVQNGVCVEQTVTPAQAPVSNACGIGCIIGIIVGVLILLLLIITITIIIILVCRRSNKYTHV